jgi:hypothetical protein
MQQLPTWAYQVDRIMQQWGVPTRVWLAIAEVESSLNPTVVNGGGPPNGPAATGLFQIVNAGARGLNALDPVASAEWAAPRMAAAIRRTGSTDPVTVAINSDWPGNIAALARGIADPEVQRWIARYNAVVVPAFHSATSQLQQWLGILTGHPDPGTSAGGEQGGEPAERPAASTGGSGLLGGLQDVAQGVQARAVAGLQGWWNEHYAAVILGGAGGILVLFGLLGLAIKAAPAIGTVAGAAVGGPAGAAAGATIGGGVKNVAGGQVSGGVIKLTRPFVVNVRGKAGA